MPSNRELTEEAERLAAELGIEVSTRYLNNAKLADLVEQLRARVAQTPPAIEGSPAAAAVDVTTEPLEVETGPTLESSPQPEGVKAVDGNATTGTGGARPAHERRSLYRHPYSVAEGCCIVTLRGKLPAFAKIRETDLAGGLAELEKLVSSGHVVRRQ